MQDILEWLDSKRSYDAGVKLYLKHGKDPLLRLLFQENYSEFKLQKLHQVMEQLAGLLPADKPLQVFLPEPGYITHSPEMIRELKSQVTELADEKDELRYQVSDLEDGQYDLKKNVDTLQEDVQKLKVAQKNAPRGWPADMDETVRSLHDQWHPFFVEKKNLQARIYDVAMAGQKDPAKKKEAGAMAHRILDLRDACRDIYKKRDHYLVHGNLPEEKKLIDIPADPNKWPLTLQNYQRYLRDYKNKLKKKPGNEDFKKQLAKYEWGVAELKKLLGL